MRAIERVKVEQREFVEEQGHCLSRFRRIKLLNPIDGKWRFTDRWKATCKCGFVVTVNATKHSTGATYHSTRNDYGVCPEGKEGE